MTHAFAYPLTQPLYYENEDLIEPSTVMADFYKLAHREQYPDKTETIVSYWTARNSRIKDIDKVVAFGFQAFIKEYLLG